jgi:hypothetical protein
MRFYILAALLLVSTSVFAQTEGAIEMLRHDIKTEKVAIMTASLPLTEKEGEAFWPMYREYSNEIAKLGDRRLAILKKVSETSGAVDEKTAEKGVKESFSIANDRNKILKKYYDKAAKIIGVVKAARFLQIETQMLTILDAQIADQVPLLKTAAPKPEKQ